MIILPVTDFEDHFQRIMTCLALADLVKRDRYFAWDVFSGTHCVASTSFWFEKTRGGPLAATLNSTAIVESFRGKGLYRELLGHRIAKIKELGLPFFEIQCSVENTPMVNFWRKMQDEGKVRFMRHYFINYYNMRDMTKMLEFRGRMENW